MLPFAREAHVVVDNRSVVDVNQAEQEKETLLCCNVAVFDVHLPKLIRSADLTIVRQLSGILDSLPALWLQDAQFLTQSVYFFSY